jgi:diaminopimelate decarboxylase
MLLGTQRVNRDGHLEIGGCDVTELAAEFGTPLYVMDEAAIRQNCRSYLKAFRDRYPKVEVSYASKAFLCLAMCPIIEEEGLNLDVASGGELYTALQGGFPRERIALHGNNKSADELQMAIDACVGRIVVDNFYELELLERLTASRDRPVDVAVRATPGIDPHTHRRIRTGQADSKFGFGIGSGQALEAVRRVQALPTLRLRGVHCHIGSQLLDADAHTQAVDLMVELLRSVRDTVGVEVEELNIGGGLGIRYLREHRPPSLEAFADQVVTVLRRKLDEAGLTLPVLQQEPGRFIVGEAGTTLYSIGSIKEIPGVRTYVSIDGGMSDNPRPQLYDAVYEAIVANKADRPSDALVTIAGKHCETDILIRDTRIAPPEPGDLLAVQSTGAYNQSMASNYNRFPRPAVVLVNDGRADLIVRRETYADLIRNELVPDRLRKANRSAIAAQ